MMSASLTRYGEEVSSVFDLLGQGENDLTAALAFALASSPGLLALTLRRVIQPADSWTTELRLETRDDLGRTDLEIDTGARHRHHRLRRRLLQRGKHQRTRR